MSNSITTKEWEAEIGTQLRSLRIRQELDQQRLASMAGVALNVVKNLEGGKGATLSSLIKILRALNHTDWLKGLAPTVSISPLQMLKTTQPRQRAARRRKGKNV